MSREDESGDALLERLEQLVSQASEEISALRSANQQLEAKIELLEKERDEGQGALSQWSEKQDEIESRLDGLVSGLEGLLSE